MGFPDPPDFPGGTFSKNGKAQKNHQHYIYNIVDLEQFEFILFSIIWCRHSFYFSYLVIVIRFQKIKYKNATE